MDVVLADAPSTILAEVEGDDRLTIPAVEGGARAAVRALAGDADAVRLECRPWDADQVVARMYDVAPVEAATVLSIDTGSDPMRMVVDVGGGCRLLLRSLGGPDGGEWRLARILLPDDHVPMLNPEDIWVMTLPDEVGPGNDLRWLCFVLQDVSELLGDGIITMPGDRPMVSETLDLGQGETKDRRWSGWDLGHGRSVGVEAVEHEIFDGATPRWGTLHGSALGLAGDAGVLVNASLNAGESALVRIVMTARADLLDATLDALRSGRVVPGSAVL